MSKTTFRGDATARRGAMALAVLLCASIGACDDSEDVAVDGQPPGADAGADQRTPADGPPADAGPAKDAPPADAAPGDVLLIPDGSTDFPQVLDGVWLVGWIGGLNRFSWIRFKVTAMDGGTAVINRGELSSGTVPYWECDGAATWNITAKPDTIQLHFPSSECTGMRSGTFTFVTIVPATSGYPAGALLEAGIEALGASPGVISGFKFPADQCDAAMTSCKDPL